MLRPHHHLRLLVIWLGLTLAALHVVKAAPDDEDTSKARKKKPVAEKTEDDTPKKKRRKEPEPEKETPKSKKETDKPAEKKTSTKDSGKSAAKTDKETPKSSAKSEEETPRRKRRKPAEDDKTKEKETASKESPKSATKSSGKTASKSSDKDTSKKENKDEPEKPAAEPDKPDAAKPSETAEATIPVSKKGDTATVKDAKDVTDQKADRPIGERAMDSEFDNEPGAKENNPKPRALDKTAPRRDAGKTAEATTSSSRDMQGWEVVHFQDRDWVTSNSLFRFYRFADHRIEGNVVWLTSPVLVMKAVIGSQELLINNIKFILSNPVEEVNGKVLFSRLDLCKLIDPVLRPSYIGHGQAFDTVIIDAGHGGYDSGARGLYGYEKNFTLQLAGQLKQDLEKRNFKVVLTRSDDTFISLGGRVEFANKVPNSIFVSLHFNSGQSAATGIETYALSPQGAASDYGARSVDSLAFNGNQRDSENIALATAIHAAVVHHFKLVDRGVKRARWYVLTGLERPGVLFEGGFVTNGGDGQLIAAENFRRELAHTIGDAITNYRRALSPSR